MEFFRSHLADLLNCLELSIFDEVLDSVEIHSPVFSSSHSCSDSTSKDSHLRMSHQSEPILTSSDLSLLSRNQATP